MSIISQNNEIGTTSPSLLSKLNGRGSYIDQAASALHHIFDRCPSDAKIVLNTSLGKGLQTKEFPLDEANVAERIAQQYAGMAGLPRVYLRATVLRQGLVLAQGQRGKREDTYGSSVLWADIDPGPDDKLEEFRARTLDSLRSFYLPPSLIVSSGRGFHAYWFTPFTTDWERIERINKALGAALDSDSTYDAARLLRMPGTFNDKEGIASFAEIVELHKDRIYDDLDAFPEKGFDPDETVLLETTFETEELPLGFEGQVKAASQRLWDRISSEATALETGAAAKNVKGSVRVDRSRNDFVIAIQLLRLHMTQGQVFSVLSHPVWFSGAKFREGYNEHYVRHTIAKASSFVGEVELTKAPEISKRLEERYLIMYHQLTWWIYSRERGAFIPGRTELAQAIQGLAGNKWTKTLQDNVFHFLKERWEKDTRLEIPEFINVANGMLRWNNASQGQGRETGRELQPPSPGYESIYQVNARWDPEVDYSEVDAAVARVFTADAARIWWMFCGFCLYTGDTKSIRCLLAIVGPRRRGKSTMLLILKEFLGPENTSSVSLSELTGEGNQFTTSRMIGKLLNVDVDAPYEIPARKISLLKKLAERQTISIERKFEGAEDADLNVKLAFAMNDFPRFGIADEAVYDRWIVLQPREDLPPMYPGKNGGIGNLEKVLLASDKNRSAWLLRSVEGLRDLMKEGSFPDTETVIKGRNRMRYESDSIYRFWLDCTEEAPGERTILSVLYDDYKGYAIDSGIKSYAGRNTFTKDSRNFAADGIIPGLAVFDQNDTGYRQATAVGRKRKGTLALHPRVTKA